MSAVTELWANSFEQALSRLGAHDGAGSEAIPLAQEGRGRFLSSLPPGYSEETLPKDAATDWLEMSRLIRGGRGPSEGRPAGEGLAPGTRPTGAVASSVAGRGAQSRRTGGHASRLVLCPCRPGAPGDFRLRRVGLARVELSSFLPVVESFGLAVVEAVPWHFHFGPSRPDGPVPDAYVDDIGLRVDTPVMEPGGFDPVEAGPRLVEALEAVLTGRGELGPLNRLVIGAGLDWREVALLSAYCAYRRVVGGPWAAEAADGMSDALVAFPTSAAAAVRLFMSLLAPEPGLPAGDARAAMLDAVAGVPDLEHDRALHELVSLVDATVRSNWALRRETISLKFASGSVPFLPAPSPLTETFVWCPWFEALHVRFGRVARGGIRWSDRHADIRSEVLGLARAQVKKNSLIVPTGAKGAFVVRREGVTGPEHGQAEHGKAAYSAFIEALLDVTDNIVGSKVVHPDGVVCRDADDPYLVVAADKGTARFSDLANSISVGRGFWLGDAFASGGSTGYDHKALGITARGAWVAVRRHFRALGMDAQEDQLRVVGVGDMSGDVFGNGMLQSNSICLIAAFDHRHIFVDPAPDPAVSYEERRRLSLLESSSWQDYDLNAASRGAAVFSRHAKKVELSPQACGALGVVGPGTMSPPELVKAVLEAQVDLIFFGGIGTFVKAPGETDRDVDDRANDEVRVNADQVRARVVAEGANLAMTQAARTSYSRRGGRVDTDFIDNAGGVAMSDREVNLKILLGQALSAGRLSLPARDEVLASSAEVVADAVLAQVEQSVVALDRAAGSSAAELPAFEALMGDLAGEGLLDVEVEGLPDPEELARRKEAGAGLSRPELAVLLAYARSELARSVEASPLAGDEAVRSCGVGYFPPGPRQAFLDLIPEHPLFRQLVSSELANEMIVRMGAIWAHEVAAETGRQLWEAAAAYWAAREVLGAAPLFAEVDNVAWTISTEAEVALRDSLSAGLGRLARWYLARKGPLEPRAVIAADRPFVAGLQAACSLDGQAPGGGPFDARPAAAALTAMGVPDDVAARVAGLLRDAAVGELAEAARSSDHEVGPVSGAYAAVEEGLSLARLEEALTGRETSDRWERWELDLLADDLARARVVAVTRALQFRPDVGGVEAAREWLAMRPGPLAHASDLVDRLGPESAHRETGPRWSGTRGTGAGGGSPDPPLPLLALALRAVGDAVRA
ncbi:MAG TPA: NAD-glutamate dehydrogenase domain-containing protein [Acidimicrobiales bacterium]|nr:NAD-glutamate dehydrogenase domain-containing protein [Acidimicrobiales bacterium]